MNHDNLARSSFIQMPICYVMNSQVIIINIEIVQLYYKNLHKMKTMSYILHQ